MARLPIPGSDEGSWGTVLNDFLAESHNADGSLKSSAVNPTLGGDLSGTTSNAQIVAGAVGQTELANNAVTSSKIANGSITADKLASSIPSDTNTGLNSLFIFYAPPNIMNARYDDNYAAGVVSRYNDAIFGSELQDPGNTYHASTRAIIEKVDALGTGTTIWGYIDLGVTTSNHSLSTLHTQIDQWVDMGIGGIFCDLVGYDYGVSRSRQNDIINYVHSKGLGAFLNVWNMDDLLASTVNMTYNPSGTPTAANNTDVLMLESWIANSDAYASPYFSTFSDIKTRGDKAVAYRTSMGIRIYALNIFGYSNHTPTAYADMFDYTNAFARIWRLDGSGLGLSNYGSTGVDLGVARPMFSKLRNTPLRPTAGYSLNSPWTQTDATDLGLYITYDPVAPSYTWRQP